jgi:hypothetical protein
VKRGEGLGKWFGAGRCRELAGDSDLGSIGPTRKDREAVRVVDGATSGRTNGVRRPVRPCASELVVVAVMVIWT